jgi:selenocysteine lyase/cysteine desulfurase
MQLVDIDSIRRAEFPIVEREIYFDNATLGPPPTRHVVAVTGFLRRMSEQGLDDLFTVSESGVDEVRAKAAALLHCDPSHVAFVRSTSHGVSLVADGIRWHDGDEVILYELDHPACVLPWLNVADHGVKVRFIRDRGRFGFDAGDLIDEIGPRTRAVCLSLVNVAHGARAPIEEIADACRERGIWLVVDAVQAVGALAVDAERLGADVVVAHGYKFLLSGFGIGVCYLSDRALAELKVRQVGWKSVDSPFDLDRILAFRLDFAEGAKRFEPSFQPLPQLFGLSATLDLFSEVGHDVVESRVLALTKRLVAGLDAKGCEVVGPQAIDAKTPIVSVALRSDAERAHFEKALRESGTKCALRESRVRLSPHFYNTEEEVDRLLACL